MKVLVIGSGGREHALIWKIAQSPHVTQLFCAPGNPGMAHIAELIQIPVHDIDRLLSFAKIRGVDLTVVGPELPLSLKIVDRFREKGLRIFGPTQAAAAIETSKVFSKSLMDKYGIPTAKSEVVSHKDAYARIAAMELPIVLKVDGLAAGKGVVIAHNQAEAIAGLDGFKKMGHAAEQVIIEEYLEGIELSFFVVTDGKNALSVGSAQDHKRVFDGNRGPNTGGMGAFSPSPLLTPNLEDEIMSKVIYPTLQAMAKEGCAYTGILYAGIMLTKNGLSVLEFNARWGDPEAQAILPRLKTDWVKVMEATIDGQLDQVRLEWETGESICLVLTSGGYPGPYEKGKPISGLNAERPASITIFHAGTTLEEGQWLSAGGRVLGVTAIGKNLAAARKQAYETIKQISFEKMHYRSDIGITTST
ncbi:MAG: phosphoribosylamine--glycine ligase [Nitrospirae bacterium]|nr:phosphoribosylamine--glycine ligase [Candidatus Manganitrophaceae bacterium]